MRSAWWTTFGDYTWKVGLGICFRVRKSIYQMACFISQSFPTSSDTRASFVNFLNLDNPFHKLFGAIINSWKFFPWTPQNDWHPILWSKHQQRRIFTLLLRGTRPIRVGKLCFPQTDLLIMRLVVQLQSLICIRKILHCLILDLVINRNPIE